MNDNELAELVDRVAAHRELLDERIRQRNIAKGLPADYEEPVDEIRARAAVLRAENDLAEARAILAATQRSVSNVADARLDTSTEPRPIEAASFSWPHTPSGKVKCPDCGHRGYPGDSWTHIHAEHVEMPCGRIITSRGRHTHRRQCETCTEVMTTR